MNRIIKFRGKPTENNTSYFKDWIYGFLVISDNKYYILLDVLDNIKRDDYEVYMIEVIPETVGQFTGLYDIEKNAIYDSDIVLEQGHFVNSDRLIYQKIQWKESYSCWLRGEYQKLTPKNIERYKIKVVGNVYDNKNLLEEK